MSDDNNAKQEVQPDTKEAKAYQLNVTLNAPGLLDVMPIEELPRAVELSRARYVYACQQKAKWDQEEYSRRMEFNTALLVQAKRIHGITDEELQSKPKTSFWSYAE